MMSKQVIVLGMHRSGTSSIALILQELGIDMGDRLLGASSSNPFGHVEDEDFLELHELILKDAKGSWDFPPKQIKLEEAFEKYKDKIKDIIKSKNTNEVWGWKEPRTTLFAKNYHGLLDNPYYICISRNELEVAQSLKKRNHMPIKKGLKLSKRYNNDLNIFLQSCNPNRVLILDFGHFHNSKDKILSQLVNFLEIRPNEDQLRRARDIIKPMKDVRDFRGELKRNENQVQYKKVFKYPFKAVRFIFMEGWKLFKYYLGV
jgi:hypothetical protein